MHLSITGKDDEICKCVEGTLIQEDKCYIEHTISVQEKRNIFLASGIGFIIMGFLFVLGLFIAFKKKKK